ncbi:GAF and ANTAR domain-containing protein [Actinophytocola sp.]|uniref:GAF and ANTAR domain-containing protein n=1 Tax=Actinophytocola sp. TaxID=1872138 RepID=UPI002D801A24|nr:GAF and ANTAR domain-containing protein [Actinophytocola sp.]HET9141161.1 GAF and ANTAR domain-containing protein [Actinophytocola sp.]
MTGPHRVAEILSLTYGEHGPDSMLLARLCQACLVATSVSGVGVALMTADGPSGVVLAATDGRARQLEELQFSFGEGPCVEASDSGRPVLQADLAVTGPTRWPGFVAAVLDFGVRAIFALPLRVGAIRVGVLDLYRDVPGQLEILELAEALAFAEAATLVVLYLQDHAAQEGDQSALVEPIERRAVVHQATGMIAVQLGISLAEALLRLRARAYVSGRPVSEVAADVVSRRMRFDDGEPGGGRQ